MSKNYKKHGPGTITEAGEYGAISTFGPLSIKAKIIAESVKSQGPCFVSEDIEAEKLKVNGPFELTGHGRFDVFKVNGPATINGSLLLNDRIQVNGPLSISDTLSGTIEVNASINGPLKCSSISKFNSLKVNGEVTVPIITEINEVKIVGKVVCDEISVGDSFRLFLRKGESKISKISATDIEIGTNLEDVNIKGGGKFGKFIKNIVENFTSVEPGTAVIGEIHSTGVVELDNVKVDKVFAKELYAGENTEIGEFIEIKD